jgi:D-aspartate ligase
MNDIIDPVSNAEKLLLNDALRNAGAVIIGGHFQGLGILRSLAKQNIPICLLDREFCIGRFSRYSKKFYKCPSVRQESIFFEFMRSLAQRQNLEGWVVYPVDDEVVTFLSKNKSHLERYYRIPTPAWEITRFAIEKKLTYQLAEKFDIPTPVTCFPRSIEQLIEMKFDFPVILKPSVKEPFYSLTRKKAIRANNLQELLDEFNQVKSICPEAEIMVQEMIPGGPQNLFSVGSFFKNGELLGKVVARRIRQHPMDFGHATTHAVTVDIPELEETARRFLRAMGYYGLSEIEFMLDPRDGRYKLLEMNARTWGWHSLAIDAGVDLPYLLYKDIQGQKIVTNEFARNVKWFHMVTDIPTVLGEIRRGRMSIADYVNSLKGLKRDAVFSITDPLPFIMEILMAPYLRIKRGF